MTPIPCGTGISVTCQPINNNLFWNQLVKIKNGNANLSDSIII